MKEEASKDVRALLASLYPAAGEVVVDYGCADGGRLAAAIAALHPAARVVAVTDSARDATVIAEALRATSNASVVVGDSLQSPAHAVIVRPSGFEGHAVLRRRIARAHAALAEGGALYLLAPVRRGALRLIGMAEDEFGNAEVLWKGGGMRLARSRKASAPGRPAADEEEPPIVEHVLGREFTFVTGPTLFSRRHLDEGTLLLLSTIALEPGPATVIDLGCGYGPLGVVLAARHPDKKIVLVDESGAAVRAAEENVRRNGVAENARVVLGFGAAGLTADAAVSHVPLHAPRGERRRLLAGVHEALRPGGVAWLVALASYDLRADLDATFGGFDVAADLRFRVYRAVRSKQY